MCGNRRNHFEEEPLYGHFLFDVLHEVKAHSDQPVATAIYDGVMAVLGRYNQFYDTHFDFESGVVGKALEQQRTCHPRGPELLQAYRQCLRHRALVNASAWRTHTAELSRGEPVEQFPQHCLAGLLRTRGLSAQQAAQQAANPADEAFQALTSDLTRVTINMLCAEVDLPEAELALAHRMRATAGGMAWSRRYSNALDEHGDFSDSLDAWSRPSVPSIPRGDPVSALSGMTDPLDVAQRWLVREYLREDKLEPTFPDFFISLQEALGTNGIDYCTNGIVPRGLRQCLLSPRMSEVLAVLCQADSSVTPPDTCRIMPAPAGLAERLVYQTTGVVWGLRLMAPRFREFGGS